MILFPILTNFWSADKEPNMIFNKGISDLQSTTVYNEYAYNDVYAITTNDGNKCYYNIPDNIFYNTEEELTEYYQKIFYNQNFLSSCFEVRQQSQQN